MCPAGLTRSQQTPRVAARVASAPAVRHGRVDVALDRPPPPVPALKVGEVHPPVHREHLRGKRRVGVHEVRGILQEEDPLHPGRAYRLQHGLQMGANEPFPIGAREQPRPGVEYLHRVRLPLRPGGRDTPPSAGRGGPAGRRGRAARRPRTPAGSGSPSPPVPRRGRRRGSRAPRRTRGARCPAGRAARTCRSASITSGATSSGSGSDSAATAISLNGWARPPPDPGSKSNVDAEGRDRAHDVGKDDRRVEREAAQGLQGDLGRELRLSGEFLEAVAASRSFRYSGR